jgi:hypothetical protein
MAPSQNEIPRVRYRRARAGVIARWAGRRLQPYEFCRTIRPALQIAQRHCADTTI